MIQKKFLSCLSRQSSDTKPRTTLVLVSPEPLLYLKFNKPKKQNVSEINLFKIFNFLQCQNNCWHTDWCQEWNIKHHFLKLDKIITYPCFPMRMFLSVSEHNSELSIANQSSQLKCVTDTISNWFENHKPQKTKISTVIYATFIQNSNQMATWFTAATSFQRVFFQLLLFARQRPSFSAHRAALRTKTDLIFPAFSSRFVDFTVQFYFPCKFSFHEKGRSSQVWQWCDFSLPITILCYA